MRFSLRVEEVSSKEQQLTFFFLIEGTQVMFSKHSGELRQFLTKNTK